jgi:hypothetical protein
VHQLESGSDPIRLGALARPRRTQQHNPHALAHPSQPAQVRGDLLQHAIREPAAGRPEGVSGLTGHGEAMGHGQPHPGP